VPAAVGDIAELGDIDMDQRAGMSMLITTQRLAGDTVDMGQPVDPAPGQHRVHRRARHIEPTSDLNRTEPATPPQAHDLAHNLGLGLAGLVCGRELRSAIPAAPSVRKRSAHFLAVRGATMNILAAAA
jgi:hypothetical protein